MRRTGRPRVNLKLLGCIGMHLFFDEDTHGGVKVAGKQQSGRWCASLESHCKTLQAPISGRDMAIMMEVATSEVVVGGGFVVLSNFPPRTSPKVSWQG
ncbi:UNVERIFIED_CONTAM: hypothetical protein Sangu_0990400 [Sesamum angustifolium]|uniref:Uncharacterized protein n=1 Tax=Sesamum angustifolium TaxID=2727405 RepID=A0AAW2PF41_9LAMI